MKKKSREKEDKEKEEGGEMGRWEKVEEGAKGKGWLVLSVHLKK